MGPLGNDPPFSPPASSSPMATPSDFWVSQEYGFTSPSIAAAVVLGRSANGPIEWKDGRGWTFKALLAQEANA